MYTLGIDHHKKYSQVAVLNSNGSLLMNIKMINKRESFQSLLTQLKEPCQAVLESGYSWGPTYDLLNELGVDVKLAHAQKVKAIASAKIKTDSIDAHTLAQLLHADLIPEVYVPAKDVRQHKDVLRQRCWLVRVKTMIKNRTHALLDRNHVDTSDYTDIFGKTGRLFLASASLPETERDLLDQDLKLLDIVMGQIRQTESWVQNILQDDQPYATIQTVPGFGTILAALCALEIHDIKRFTSPAKLASYAGLIPSTYASGGKTFHGHLISGCNQWLRYAFIEAAWGAINHSPYYRAFYRRLKLKKTTNIAIAAVARKLSETVFHCLNDNRPYEERVYVYQRSAL
jgi:transposase